MVAWTTDMLLGKVDAAEAKAISELRARALIAPGQGHEAVVAALDQQPAFLKASPRMQARMVAARDVLVACRKVRQAVEAGDMIKAAYYARYVEQGADMLDAARRGAKAAAGASKGGEAKRRARAQAIEARNASLRAAADKMRAKNPTMSDAAVGDRLARDPDVEISAATIRKVIKRPKP
jgi:hypothetical protein